MNGLHRNPHRASLRAGDVDTELLYVWCAHRNQFTVVWKYFQQGKMEDDVKIMRLQQRGKTNNSFNSL